jgi:hypothetical protein
MISFLYSIIIIMVLKGKIKLETNLIFLVSEGLTLYNWV